MSTTDGNPPLSPGAGPYQMFAVQAALPPRFSMKPRMHQDGRLDGPD